MVQNRSGPALAKFTGAEMYAPAWVGYTRNGASLFYAGKPDEAKKQWAIAARLDLAAGDKSELMSFSAKEGGS